MNTARDMVTISLGFRCATAFNLRRFCKTTEAFPFDWWITAAESSVVQVIERMDAEWLYRASSLERTDDRMSVRHTPTGILFHHEFPRIAGEGTPIVDDFLSHVDQPKARTAYLLGKLADLNRAGVSITFFREQLRGEDIARALRDRFDLANWNLCDLSGPSEDNTWGWQGNPAVWDAAIQHAVTTVHGSSDIEARLSF